jgi:hypothetical protein
MILAPSIHPFFYVHSKNGPLPPFHLLPAPLPTPSPAPHAGALCSPRERYDSRACWHAAHKTLVADSPFQKPAAPRCAIGQQMRAACMQVHVCMYSHPHRHAVRMHAYTCIHRHTNTCRRASREEKLAAIVATLSRKLCEASASALSCHLIHG